jgi:hypothetical protein
VVQHHQQRDESARAIQRNDTFRGDHGLSTDIGFLQHHFSSTR